MARTVVVQAGPLIAASANKIGTTQKAAISGTNTLVLDGAATDANATAICAAQTPSGAGALTLNGTYATTDTIAGAGGPQLGLSGAVVRLPYQRTLYFTCAANESGRTVAIQGTQMGPNTFGTGIVVGETLTLANASKVATLKAYDTITSIIIDGAGTGNISVGMNGVATLDNGRRVLFTPAGNDASISYNLTGTDYWSGALISETLAGVANPSTTYSVLDYGTVTSITTTGAIASTMTIGTNQICSSAWVRADELASMAPTGLQVDGLATVNWTVQQVVGNDPNVITNQLPTPTYQYARSAVNWVNHPDSGLVAQTTITGVQGNYAYPWTFSRILMNSNGGTTAYARLSVTQSYLR